ncbi:esterase OVCA2-like [Xenia sp. Carnegie-2017]|uniref:esterase OVCA2-like n=1 Tax=Xenia sp. Carnegie-2017 TaxID=2897299 RepID=UPI001F048359|nr:esterase OVCA2-like [Xenia sp. Carnegie-2017]
MNIFSQHIMAERSQRVLKILCIHGYRQSGKIFKEKTGSFRKGLKKIPVEFVYVTAPNRIPSIESDVEEQFGWWFSTEENTYDALTKSHYCKGYEGTITFIKDVFLKQGPFDGVFSFSQGASLTSLLCAMNSEEGSIIKFKFAIMIAGFKSRSSQHDIFYEKPIKCASLHVYGETDQVIPKENSEKLAKYFENPVCYCHPGGHFVPASSQHRQVYIDFIQEFLSAVDTKVNST